MSLRNTEETIEQYIQRYPKTAIIQHNLNPSQLIHLPIKFIAVEIQFSDNLSSIDNFKYFNKSYLEKNVAGKNVFFIPNYYKLNNKFVWKDFVSSGSIQKAIVAKQIENNESDKISEFYVFKYQQKYDKELDNFNMNKKKLLYADEVKQQVALKSLLKEVQEKNYNRRR